MGRRPSNRFHAAYYLSHPFSNPPRRWSPGPGRGGVGKAEGAFSAHSIPPVLPGAAICCGSSCTSRVRHHAPDDGVANAGVASCLNAALAPVEHRRSEAPASGSSPRSPATKGDPGEIFHFFWASGLPCVVVVASVPWVYRARVARIRSPRRGGHRGGGFATTLDCRSIVYVGAARARQELRCPRVP